jgi:hypothetical protein
VNLILKAILVFIAALLFIAFHHWDVSQGGQGFQGIKKVLKQCLSLLMFIVAAAFTIAVISGFAASGFWAGFFGLLLLSATGVFCYPISIISFIIVILAILNHRYKQ